VPILNYLLVRHFAVKWYGKFSVKRITDFVDEEFPIVKQDRLEEKPSSSKTSIEIMFVGKSVKDMVEIAQMVAQMCAKWQPKCAPKQLVAKIIHLCPQKDPSVLNYLPRCHFQKSGTKTPKIHMKTMNWRMIKSKTVKFTVH
jgi:hypothetical protein